MMTPYKLLYGMSLLRDKKRLQSQENENSEDSSFLRINIRDHAILIRQSEIEEIIPVLHITPILGTKPWFKGLTSFRGNLLPLVDLAILLGINQPDNTNTTDVRILVIQTPENLLGLYIDKVESIRHYWLKKVTQPQSEPNDVLARYCHLYRMQNDHSIFVLNMQAIRRSIELMSA